MVSHTTCLQVCRHKGCLLHSTESAPAVHLVEACSSWLRHASVGFSSS